MFLLLERNHLIPLSHNKVCKMGDWGGGCCKARPNHRLEGCTERRGQPERGGGGNADSDTHSSWVLLRDGEEEGVALPAAGNKTKCLLPAQVAALQAVQRAKE